MSNRPILDILRELRFASGLPANVVTEIAAVSRVCEFRQESILFREGAECHDLFLVEAGHVALEMHVPARGSVRILTVGPGEMLGWSALIAEGRMTVTATALDEVSAVAIPGPTLRVRCDTDHELGYQVMRQMASALSQRLLATRLQLLDLFAHEFSNAVPSNYTSPPVKDHAAP